MFDNIKCDINGLSASCILCKYHISKLRGDGGVLVWADNVDTTVGIEGPKLWKADWRNSWMLPNAWWWDFRSIFSMWFLNHIYQTIANMSDMQIKRKLVIPNTALTKTSQSLPWTWHSSASACSFGLIILYPHPRLCIWNIYKTGLKYEQFDKNYCQKPTSPPHNLKSTIIIIGFDMNRTLHFATNLGNLPSVLER